MDERGEGQQVWTVHIYETGHHRGGYSITKKHTLDDVVPSDTVRVFMDRLSQLGCDTSDVQAFDPSLLCSTERDTGKASPPLFGSHSRFLTLALTHCTCRGSTQYRMAARTVGGPFPTTDRRWYKWA